MALGDTKNGNIPMTRDIQQISTTLETTVQNEQKGSTEKNMHKQNKQIDATISFLRAGRSGELGKVIEFIESGQVTDINACNANGLNALHLAAKDGFIDIVAELLRRGANVDNATKKGNTALHIASLAGQKEVIKLLIHYNANVNVQSLNGFTPLYMAAQENHDACVRYLLAKGANPSLATEDGFTPLAVAMQQGHDKVVAVLLESDSRGKVRLPALHIAAKKDDVKAATLLLENEHNPDIVSKSGFTPLHIAAHYGNVEIAKLLIERGADVNYIAKHNITPLHVACKWGKKNILLLLLSKNARIDATTRDGLTPLHCAARSGHKEVIELLLENGAPILLKTKNGLAPLHMAAQGEHSEAARILLSHKAPVDEVTIDYLTALHVSAHCGHVKVAKLLLDHNADPNARALNGFTPLHIACKKNRIKVVELLLKNNASISATTESGLTPLHVASFMGSMNIVIYLLQHDANPDAPTVRGETPLHLAARANQTDIIQILLRNGAQVDAQAREGQTPLHVSSRLGNIDIIMLILQHGANVDSVTKDAYTPLHIAAKEGQEEVVAVLIDNNASLDAKTKKSFSPLHLAAKYGRIQIVKLLLEKGAVVDCQGKNGVTPLHVACHYDHEDIALLLLEKGALPQASAKNGHTALHIAARKNQMNIATNLLKYEADPNVKSKSGFAPLHLAAQEGHVDMVNRLLEHGASPNISARNGLTPMHLCAQEDRVKIAQILIDNNAQISERTKAGYTPLHVAAHFGQISMVKFLLENDANIELSTNVGYTPLHQAAQQGHTLVINLLLTHKANPNALTNNGQTPLNIANKLGYVTAVETLKVVTENSITNSVTGVLEEKYKVIAPESMHEAFMSDSEDEGGEDHLDQHQYKYMATDDLKTIINENDQHNYDTTDDDQINSSNRKIFTSNNATPNYVNQNMPLITNAYQLKSVDNVQMIKQPIYLGFLVSFLVDARGGSMRGCRHSGVRVVVPPKSCVQPTRITCRYVKPQRVTNPPPLMEGEALVSRIMELSPVEAKFLGSVVLEVPHFGSLRDKERQIIILRSDNGETWREHTLYDSEEPVRDVLNETFESNDLSHLEDLHTSRIVRIATRNFPHFFAVVSRIRQEVHAIGPEGGTVSSTAVPQVQALFPPNALTKKIRVGLQAQPVDLNDCCKLLGQGVAVSPVVTVEPRRRKFHKAITLSIPVPKTYTQGMVNQYSGNAPTLRLLCSITGGQNRAVWEDVTGSTPLTFVKDSVSFTTTVSARFWLIDCRNVSEVSRMATEFYSFMAQVPFMVKFVVFAKRLSSTEAKLSVFCMTDDKEDKTLEHQEYFTEVARSRDVEVLENQEIYLEFAGYLLPVLKSGEQLNMKFHAFRENRLSFLVRVKDQEEPFSRINFMSEPKISKGETPQIPICTLSVSLTDHDIITDNHNGSNTNLFDQGVNYRDMLNFGYRQTDEIHRADIRLSDICNLLKDDWVSLAKELQVPDNDIDLIKSEYKDKETSKQAMVMLRLWLRHASNNANGNTLEQALHKINRSDIVEKCIFNLQLVTNYMEKVVAKMQFDQSGFDALNDEIFDSNSCDNSLEHVTYDNTQHNLSQQESRVMENEKTTTGLSTSVESLPIEISKEKKTEDDQIDLEHKQENYNHIEEPELDQREEGTNNDDLQVKMTAPVASAEYIQSQKDELKTYLDDSILSMAAEAAELHRQQKEFQLQSSEILEEEIINKPVKTALETTSTTTEHINEPKKNFDDNEFYENENAVDDNEPTSLVFNSKSNTKDQVIESYPIQDVEKQDVPCTVLDPVKTATDDLLKQEKNHLNNLMHEN